MRIILDDLFGLSELGVGCYKRPELTSTKAIWEFEYSVESENLK